MNNEFKNRNSEECGGESNNAKRLRMLGDSSAEAIHLEENKNFKVTAIEKGKSNRDYFNAYQLYTIIHNLAILFKQKVQLFYIFVEIATIQ